MYDKSKKSWSQRLKTLSSSNNSTNNDNQIISGQNSQNVTIATASGMQQQQHRLLHPHPHLTAAYCQLPPPGYEFLPGALSRSMKYAEPWIYGTVRGIPLRPSGYGYHHHHHQQQQPHAAAIFAPETTEPGLAVVICSCAEYLSGTKRDVKKASICKKCKGSRLPLATIGGGLGGGGMLAGGTLRLTAATCSSSSRSMAATMRVVSSTKKSRPSILDPQKDPYDLMRRTRLLSPEPAAKSESTKEGIGNGKSRSRDNAGEGTQRGRSRTRAQLPPPPLTMAKAKPEPSDCWLTEDNEFLLQSSGFVTNSNNGKNRRSILRCSVNPYELISVDRKMKNSNNHDDFDVADAQLIEDEDQQQQKQQQQHQLQERQFYGNNVAAIAGQRISLGSDNLNSDLADSSDSYEKIMIAATPTAPAAATPRRPPRNKKSDEPIESSTTLTGQATPLMVAVFDKDNDNDKDKDKDNDEANDNDSSSFTVLTVTPTSPSIKSILKRPATLDLPAVGATISSATVETLIAVEQPDMDVATASSAAATPLLTPSGKSQFYIPTPTATPPSPYSNTPTPTSSTSTSSSRKKVQFMVEDKIIATNTIATAAAPPLLTSSETRTTNTETSAITLAQATTAEAATTNRDYDDDDEHNDKDENKKSNSSISNNSYRNIKEKPKQKEEKEKEKERERERKEDGNARPRASQKRAQQTTQSQSRNPIRRAHSERHLSNSKTAAAAATSTPQQHSSHQANSNSHSNNNNNTRNNGPPNVILNFKDTMALRIKSNRNDSRDLFQRRPTEPPPPPPTTTTMTTTTVKTSAAAETRQQHPRTVVRVAPFNKNQQNGEVHRLKISHSEEEETVVLRHKATTSNNNNSSNNSNNNIISRPLDEEDKKTSILINGDDCYSTMNLSADAAQPLYQSSVVVNSHSTAIGGSVCINVSSLAKQEEQLNQLNMLNSQQMAAIAVIPIKSSEVNLQRSVSCISSTSSSSTSSSSSSSGRGRTLIRLDYDKEQKKSLGKGVPVVGAAFSSTAINVAPAISSTPPTPPPPPLSPPFTSPASSSTAQASPSTSSSLLVPHETELLKILRNPVEAVKRNLVPHVCGLNEVKKPKDTLNRSFMSKLLEDPIMGQVADGLDQDTVAELIENSLQRLQQSRRAIDMSGTKDHDDMNRLISISLKRIRQERQSPTATSAASVVPAATTKEEDDRLSQRGSISSANSFASAHNYELFDFEANSNIESDCYQSCSSVIGEELEDRKEHNEVEDVATRAKFYQLLVDATLAEIELSTHAVEDAEHHYESIRQNGDPIYEEIHEKPPPLPLTAPPLNEDELTTMEKKCARSIFEGASKYDILSYLVDAKERGLVREESFDYSNNPKIIEEEATDTLSELDKRSSHLEDGGQSNLNSLSPPPHTFMCGKSSGGSSDVERQDSGVGSETSKSSRSKYQATPAVLHLCEDCDGPVETQMSEAGVLFAPLVCRKCGKKRVERKEIITEIVETEEKYGRDLQIILEEFCHPMLVAGLLNQEQLSAIFLNTEDLLENNHLLADRMRDALDIALEQGDDDLLTVNIGRIFLDFTQMLHAFESYCVRQAGASLLLANLEKEKELLRIFLKVSQMENAVLRRMNLNSFLMVPVQRVTKYPLLLARLFKVTPSHLDGRELLKQAQEKIELHLNHINQEAKDVPTKLWRRISSSSPNRRASCEIDMINIKLRKMAIDILEWNHDEVRFAMEGKLLYTQPTDSNWKKARTIKLTPVNALLVTNGKPSANYRAEKAMSDKLNFPKHTGIREASLLMVKEKCGRYTLIREPLYLDRCVVCSEADWDDYFEVQEISSKDTFIFKAEDGVRTKQWYTQLQYHAQGMGAWRKRRNALANIMINGMLARS
ncbi:uncharacterized protein RhoGEF64C [Drosophila tropicalis]|uniref:uncharacterized protein RhoGEF64C n=1 Tax=Drosophila tropicalis TaxID=46794 RepID=UPI0035ABF27D